MHKAVKKNKSFWRYMESLSIQTHATTVHWEENTIYVYVVESKIVTNRVKHTGANECLIQEN